MKHTMHFFSFKFALPAILATGILAATLNAAPPEPAVDPATHAAHVAAGTQPAAPDASKGDPALSQQLSQLQAKGAQLEAALAKTAPPVAADSASAAMPSMADADTTTPPGPMAGAVNPGMNAGATTAPAMAGTAGSGGGMNMMGMMEKMMEMMDKMMSMEGGMMPMGGAQMSPAAPGGMGKGMAMDKIRMVGMMGMPPMGGRAPGAMPQSSLPGFPGASHLYHLGATDFFLDHEAHIALTTEQTAALNQAKEKAALAKSTADRAIAQAEQELWTLTASDQPDIAAIEAKTAEIGKLTGDARVAFIRAVGEASKILTDEQRKILTGFAPPAPAGGMATPAPAGGMPGMPDM